MSEQLYTSSQLKLLDPKTAGMLFQAVLLQTKVSSRMARNGSEFLVVELSDAGGSIITHCFSNSSLFSFFKNSPEGSVLYVQGQTDYYQERLSPKLISVEALSEEKIQENDWLSKLIPSSSANPDSLWEELIEHIQAIKYPPLRQTVERVFNEIEDKFKETPGAISMHHAYKHGLLEHTVHVARAARALLPLYPEVHADLALAGALLHDIGKTLEYVGDRVTKKSQIGILQGHVVLGYRMARKAALQSALEETLLERLEHIILSHQGELEWGAAAMAATPEAVFVSLVDNLDAKMGVVQHTLKNNEEGFSAFLPALKTSLLTTPIQEEI